MNTDKRSYAAETECGVLYNICQLKDTTPLIIKLETFKTFYADKGKLEPVSAYRQIVRLIGL